MRACGFSLVELLVALTVSALLCGAVAGALPAARAAFDATPAAIDLQQRSRAGVDALVSSLQSAGGLSVGAAGGVSLSSAMPVLLPMVSPGPPPDGGDFSEVLVVSAIPGGGQGLLEQDQAGSSGALTLDPARLCPHADEVCGFRPGSVAAIVDGYGRYDIFVVGSADAAWSRLVPTTPLSAPYKAEAALVEVEASRFGLSVQADGSTALVRHTANGATQPIVDGVSGLGFDVWALADSPVLRWDDTAAWASYGPPPPPVSWYEPSGAWGPGESCVAARDGSGPLTRLAPLGEAGSRVRVGPAQLQDGPWCPGGSVLPGYDADALRLRRVDITLRMEVLSAAFRGPAGRLFTRAGTSRDPLRWVPDRTITISVAMRNVP